MPTIVPSQIVQYIENTFSAEEIRGSKPIELVPARSGALNALLLLVERVPNGLLPSDSESYAQVVRSLEEIRFAVRKAEAHDYRAEVTVGPYVLRPAGTDRRSAVAVIKEAFAKCPDQIPSLESREFSFITEREIRLGLLRDLAATRSAVLNEEWRGATVMAGSLVEALLLWAVSQKQWADIRSACESAISKKALAMKLPPPEPLEWNLHQYIEVAAELGLIEKDTAIQARLAKDFRNLIHPGRALRRQQDCDRGSALAANAAVEMIARDLRQRFS
jgi:hypothetical protein